MAQTIQQGFAQLSRNLAITSLQGETVSARQNRIRDVVQSGFSVQDSFLTGSYARNTMISPLSQADIDVFCVLNSSIFHNYQPASLLDAVRRTLLRTYTRTPDISRSGQAVSVRFDDFVIDVVPSFDRQGGGYLIPNSVTQSWLSTDPKKHVSMMSDANGIHDGSLVPLIKMLKGWNRTHSSFFRSFHIEVLCLKIFENVRITDYPSGVRFFFDKARSMVRMQNLDPAGYGDDVGKYIDSTAKIEDAASRLDRAFNTSVRAEQEANRYNVRAAFDEWRKLFSDYMPAYG